jgi:regulator of protease activity HflC (stomatin/prohibitin superfamily)
MSFLFICALIFVLLGVVGFVIAKLLDARGGPWLFGGLAVGLVFLVLASFTQVPAQSVGVLVSFGKPIKEIPPGLHVKRPWAKVVDMDGRTQTEIHNATNRVEIRLGNQATGYVQSSLRWKIRPEAAGSLYADYRTEADVGPKLVDLELAAAMNAAFSDYDPLSNIRADAGDKTAKKISNDDLSARVQTRLDTRIGKNAPPGLNQTVGDNRIIIEQVVIAKVDFDDATQSRINQLQQEIGNTRIAEQRRKTIDQEAQSNTKLAASVSHDPNVIVSKCMDQQREAIEKGQQLPPGGFGCWPGNAPNVIVNRSQ